MKNTRKVFWKIFAPVAVVVTFLVFLLMGIKRGKQITKDRIRYFLRIPVEALRRPFDGFSFLPRGKKGRILFRLNLGKKIKWMVKILKRPFVLFEPEDD